MIVTECAACHRARPDNQAAVRRLHESVQFAARHHSVNEIAGAATLAPAEVESILQPQLAPVAEKSRARGFARTASARTAGTFRNSPA